MIALDMPPFGFSQRPGPYTLSHGQQLVTGFVERLRLRLPIVVGHSLGAALAVRYALSHPSRSLLGYGIQGVSRADLEQVRTRRLVVWGAEDTVDGVAAGRKTAALLHARFVLVPRAGHFRCSAHLPPLRPSSSVSPRLLDRTGAGPSVVERP